MADPEIQQVGDEQDRFVWHPDYAGQTFEQVEADFRSQIESDQRAHRLAMEGAEEAEHDALTSVVNLERKWSPYDFDWAEMDASVLAARIVAFERERESRREMISWADYRAERADDPELTASGDVPAAELSTGIKATALIVVALLIVVILLIVWAL